MATSPTFILPYYPVSPPGRQRPARFDEESNAKSASSPNADKNDIKKPITSPSNIRQRRGTQSHQKLVFSDPVAFRYLEEDPSTIVLDRRRKLEGYELYIVEQWVCSRTNPTFVICTYTGDTSHSILVNVLSVPIDENTWSSRLKVYFQAMSQINAKRKETPLGTIMVTNLSGFPSALTVIPVPEGDVKKYRDDFMVNEDLKRMGCSGRAAVNLQHPQSSTVAKFHQLYRTSESIPLYQSVIELVKLCQTALIMYGKLQQSFADGLLCDVTEKAINDWWTDIGIYFYNVEPSDGILGPTTVAALIGLLIGAYNRLKAFGAPVGKDILDIASMKRAIGNFQKGQKMEKTRRLDRETLDRLHRATAKLASGEGWTVPKAVKSTVAELSGKGGEMVMGIVGGRDKAAISDVETLDMDRFVQLVSGPRMKWLWHGKHIKSTDHPRNATDELNGRIFSTDDQGNFLWTSGRRDTFRDRDIERSETGHHHHHVSDGKSGFGRIRDAVGGRKTHSQHPSRDLANQPESATSAGLQRKEQSPVIDHFLGPVETVQSPVTEASVIENSPTNQRPNNKLQQVRTPTENRFPSHREQLREIPQAESPRKKKIKEDIADLRDEFKADVYQNFSSEFEYLGPQSKALRRSQSAIHIVDHGPESHRQNRLNRQLSFSLVENTIFGFRSPLSEELNPEDVSKTIHTAEMASRNAMIAIAQRWERRVLRAQQALIPFTESQVAHVQLLDRQAQEDIDALNSLYYQRFEEYQTLRATSTDVVSREKSSLTENLRRIEVLGAKLDYELSTVQARIQEVEEGVSEFERNVHDIEPRVKKLIGNDMQNTGPWFQRFLNLLGSRK